MTEVTSHVELDLSLVEKVIYINLKIRPERNAEIQNLLQRLNIAKSKIIRFDAVMTQPGYIGCAKSHEAVLKIARDNQWENILVLEDDIDFNHDDENIARVNGFLSMLKSTTWDVAMLAANYYKVMPFAGNHHFLRVKYAHTACAYMVNRNYYQTLINNINEAMRKLEAGGRQVSCALDSHWLPLMLKDKWFGVYPSFGYQKIGYSDIQCCVVNYTKAFSKPLSDISVGIYEPSSEV
ncbi:glycosyltransferase [Enterobacteriaceae bacterium 4M9]|nr:glycosyltransferase [Enterobacteriaceae bacterium 4M9]